MCERESCVCVGCVGELCVCVGVSVVSVCGVCVFMLCVCVCVSVCVCVWVWCECVSYVCEVSFRTYENSGGSMKVFVIPENYFRSLKIVLDP